MTVDPKIAAALKGVSTGTITTVLLKKGLRNVWMRGTRPIRAGQPRLLGHAFTLRFVPAREDLATPASWSSPISTRSAIEAMPEGCIAVADAMGVTDAGIFGDILCARMAKRNVAGLVTDGVMRDMHGVLGTGLPVWCQGTAAPASVAAEQEALEEWIMGEVNAGASLPGLYPPNAENKARYDAWKTGQK